MYNHNRELAVPAAGARGVRLFPLGVEISRRLVRLDAELELPSMLPVRIVLPDCRSGVIGSFENLRIEHRWIVGDSISKGWGTDVNIPALGSPPVFPMIEFASVEQVSTIPNDEYVEITRGRVRALLLFVGEV